MHQRITDQLFADMSKPGGQAGGVQGGAGQQGGNMRALSDKLIEDLRQGKIR